MGKKHYGRRIVSLLLVMALLLQPQFIWGSEESIFPVFRDKQGSDIEENLKEPDSSRPSDGSLAGAALYFVNQSGPGAFTNGVRAVFDGGIDEAANLSMDLSEENFYTVKIPEGDYSQVTFYNGDEAGKALGETWYLYESEKWNTFYYTGDEKTSHWGGDSLAKTEEGNEENPITEEMEDGQEPGSDSDLTGSDGLNGSEKTGTGASDGSDETDGEEADKPGDPNGDEDDDLSYTAPSDGSLSGERLKFVNLYWETEDMGEIQAVFDGGTGEALVQTMDRQDRGVYETWIPDGDYSRVTFQKAEEREVEELDPEAEELDSEAVDDEETAVKSEEELASGQLGLNLAMGEKKVPKGLASYNLYGVHTGEGDTETTTFEANRNNTFYYDLGANPSYWGADPDYEETAVQVSEGTDADSQAEVNPGDMVYFINMNRVEDPQTAVREGDRIHISFLKKDHAENKPVENGDGVAYTMYERRVGIYSAPFPEDVAKYDEIAFQIAQVNADGTNGDLEEVLRHYNFRGDSEGAHIEGENLKFGYFNYQSSYMDAFYYNTSEDDSYWGAHPGVADDSLDTQVLYVDVKDYNKNGITAKIDDLWIKWKGMKADMKAGYNADLGYRITDTLLKEDSRYFQFPYNSGATENTILTLSFKVSNEEGSADYHTYKFTLVPRSGKNCLQLDNYREFNGQMWTTFEVGEIEKRTIFFHNQKTTYDEVQMRLGSEEGTYANKEVLNDFFEQDGLVEEGDGSVWLSLKKLEDTEAEPTYRKTNLYQLEIPSAFTHVQFRGKKEGETSFYYSRQEEISTSLSYPCYYPQQTGAASPSVPQEDSTEPGITGFWRSVYSADTSGDESVNIPEGTYQNEEGAYYANTTFYDYYSDWEMSGRKLDSWQPATESDWKGLARIFNNVAVNYYKEKAGEENEDFQALYANAHGDNDLSYKDFEGKLLWNAFKENKLLQNKWTGNGGGPRKGIVSSSLSDDGKITIRDDTNEEIKVELPFFNEAFLRGENSLDAAVGNVYKNVRFPFTKDMEEASRTYGYWVFDSARADDTFRLSYDVDEGYFLDRTKKPLEFRGRYAFFPFNDAEEFPHTEEPSITFDRRWGKINHLFGTRMELDFSLTENAEVYNTVVGESQPIKFEFQGDDDTWIYVDGILALDLGGIHDAVRGEINFKDGTYTIWRSIKGSGKTDYEGEGTRVETNPLPAELTEKLKDRTANHTLTMFYMERGLYESNLKLSFNFPRQNQFTVDKEVDITTNSSSGQEDIFRPLLENMGGFQFELKNQVTSGKALSVENSAGYLKAGEREPLYNSETEADFAMEPEAGTAGKEGGGYHIVQQSNLEGQKPKEEDLLKISPKGGSLDVSDMTYLRLAMENKGVSDNSGRTLYLSFVDKNNNRVGGYASALGYQGENNSFVRGEESVLRIDFRKMTGADSFDWSRVAYMLIGVRKNSEAISAAYDVRSIVFFEELSQVQAGGFGVVDEQISDYGSYESGTLMPVDGVWYTKQNQLAGGGYDVGVSRQSDSGTFALADGQRAAFVDKFRTGSYLSLTEENVDPKVFDTLWTIREDGEKVAGHDLLNTRIDVTTVKNPLSMVTGNNQFPLEDMEGIPAGFAANTGGDNREEVINAAWPGLDKFRKPETANTLVYRSYRDPDNTSNTPTDINVTVKNTLKRGSLTIVKKLSDAMKKPGTTEYKPGDYTFDIYYTDIAGMGLEYQLAPVEGNNRYLRQTVTVHVDKSGTGSVTVPNIPAGTQYHIVERPSNGADLVNVEIGECTVTAGKHSHENVKIIDRTTGQEVLPEAENVDYSKTYVTGTAYDSDQEVIFTNENKPFYMDIEKIWRDGLSNEEREKLGIDAVYIKLQRRTYREGQGAEAGWETVTRNFFDERIVDKEGCLKLTAKDEWKTTSSEPLPYKDEETGGTYEYRIQEIDAEGKLKNYEVSYHEEREEDMLGANGEPILHITYQAINTPVGISLRKIWEDHEDISKVRLEKVRVKLVGAADADANAEQWQCYRALGDPDQPHECDENCYLELTKGSAWKKGMDSLPRDYYYKLAAEQVYVGGKWISVEEDINGYKPTYSEPMKPGTDALLELTVKNTIETGNITIRKKDAETKKDLQGAKFKLERLIPKEDTPDENLEVDTTFPPQMGTTSATGEIQFRYLPYGKYKISETKAPGGYILLKKPVYVTVDQEAFEAQAEEHEGDLDYDPNTKTITVTILNEKGLSIPLTGGRGTWLFTMAGMTLLGAGMLLYNRRRKRLWRVTHPRKKI